MTETDPRLSTAVVAALNDYAGHLLSTGPATAEGRELLKEADKLVRRGEHGWTQITLNLARSCRAAGDLTDARDYLQSVRDYCRTNGLERV
ncbi:hypothetical protein ACN28C_19620 [Plantactinospora sp. WMMC1484]|uniref:hypothetical protein n=1 Tax=Plantactinospora sp. WMMC1484 TaxID=3404122 RepID=UPI003BF514A2